MAKDSRKARQELEQAQREHEAKAKAPEEEEVKQGRKASVSAVVLPDRTSSRNEKDVQVWNVSLGLDNG